MPSRRTRAPVVGQDGVAAHLFSQSPAGADNGLNGRPFRNVGQQAQGALPGHSSYMPCPGGEDMFRDRLNARRHVRYTTLVLPANAGRGAEGGVLS